MRRTRRWHLVLLLAIVLGLAGCSVPASDGARPVDDDIAALLTRDDASSGFQAGQQTEVVVVWVQGDRLVPADKVAAAVTAQEQLDAALAALVAGPSAYEQQLGLTTLLPPDLAIVGVVDGSRAVLDLTTGSSLEPGRVPLAVGQSALTALAVPGVRRVLYAVEGEPTRVPLPDGTTARVVRASDFASVTG